ncbi:MAG: HelD family protein [Kineosporiaceae bacterium]
MGPPAPSRPRSTAISATVSGTAPTHPDPSRPDGDDAAREALRAAEQDVLDQLYRLLEAETHQTAEALRVTVTADIGATPAARLEQEALARSHAHRLTQLQAAVDRLCFGRIDREDGASFHLGRVGLAQDGGEGRALLDWRAPAAAAFYQATGARPMGLVRRRHLRTRDRKVTDVHDELLSLDAGSDPEADAALDTDSALLAALEAPRDGRMHEVVATIQAEQDRIVRAPLRGTLVVQGAPGTGKTVVALHRAAYLLYTYREQLRSGVLIVGPGEAFLRYIGQVLPSLGETGAELRPLGGLHEGAEATAVDAPAVAALKGDLRMTEVLRRAVARLPSVPERPVPLDVDGDVVLLRPRDVEDAVRRARAEGTLHNEARVTFVRHLLERLLRQLGRVAGYAPEDVTGATRTELLRALHASRDVRREVNRCWPLTTPERLLARLLRDPARLRAAGGELLTREEQASLHRDDPDAPWTVADVALLDEAAEILGEDPEPRRRAAAAAAAARTQELQYARGVTEMTGTGDSVDAERLAARYAAAGADDDDQGPRTFGHVVVDEAQELTPMQWRAVLRRCPTRSMTVVGDMGQATSPGASASWERAFAPHLGRDRWTVGELTVNYRLPSQINDLAHATVQALGVEVSPARAVRQGRDAVTVSPIDGGDVTATTRRIVARELASGVGTVAVLAVGDRLADLREEAEPEPDRLAVVSPVEAKGLEFDVVVLLCPEEILADVGARGLYVALTRATQRLHVVGALP